MTRSTDHQFGRSGLRALLGAVLATALLAACAQAGDDDGNGDDPDGGGEASAENINLNTSDEPGEPGGRLTYGLEAETDGWNPTVSRWAPSGLVVAKAIFDTLAAYDEESGWKPNLAESFEPNGDYTEWVITLREGVTFHDGSPLTGEAAARSLNYLKDSPLTGIPFEPVESIEATGELEITATMVDPWVNFPFAMTTQIGVIGEPDWLESGDTLNPVGTGPFELVDWTPGSSMLVGANEDYWREGYPLVEEIEFLPIIDDTSRANSLRQGQLDLAMVSNGREISAFKEEAEEGEVQVVSDPAGETSEVLVMLNTQVAPLDDPDARRAVALATDSQLLIDLLADGEFEPAYGPFAPSSPWYAETDYPHHDLDAATELVDEVVERHGEFSFTLYATPTPMQSEATQLLQSQWGEAGIDVNIETLEQAQLITRVLVGDYQATMWQQFDSPHPLGDSIWWHPEASADIPDFALNFARNENPVIGDELDAARETTDEDEEWEHYAEVQRQMAEDIPYVWLYHTQYSIVAQPYVVNLVNYELPDGTPGLEIHGGSHPLWQVWLDR